MSANNKITKDKKPRTNSAPQPKTDISTLNQPENLQPFRNLMTSKEHKKKRNITYDVWCQSYQKVGSTIDTVMLQTGFGMRNVESLQRALRREEEERRRHFYEYLARLQAMEAEQEWSTPSPGTSTSFEDMSSTEITSGSSMRKHYLMEIEPMGEEEEIKIEEPVIKKKESVLDLTSEAMRQAQRYLKNHRIFEFFKFLIAHMLSATPDNPIEFLIDLLDKCLIYRFGSGNPPVLYEKHHLEQLFHMMDRMDTGYIEPHQYKTAMATLSIECYNKNPPLSTDGMVNKATFIAEAYKRLVAIFDDLIKPRP